MRNVRVFEIQYYRQLQGGKIYFYLYLTASNFGIALIIDSSEERESIWSKKNEVIISMEKYLKIFMGFRGKTT